MSENEGEGSYRHYFDFVHTAGLLVALFLLVVSVATAGQAIWRLVQTEETTEGRFVEVSESRVSNRAALYNLVLQDERGELIFVRLRNNGRILNYLIAHPELTTAQVTVTVQRGLATMLNEHSRESATIRESRSSPMLQLGIGLFPLLLVAVWVLLLRAEDGTL